MAIQRGTSISYYQQIKQKIINKIKENVYRPDDKIPSERELCEIYSVSRTTIRKAIDELQAEGILCRKSGKGTFVTDKEIKVREKTGNILFLRCVHSNIESSVSAVKDDVFYPKVLIGVEITASSSDYNCIIKTINENNFNQQELEKVFDNVDGIVCGELHNEEFLNFLLKVPLPVVLVSPSIISSVIDIVEIDNIGGAESAVSYLIESGHHLVGFIGGPAESIPSKMREKGYLQALEHHNRPLEQGLQISGGWRLEDGYNGAVKLLNRQPRPTAIFAASDLLAIGAINAVKDYGLAIPQDISMIGFDDIELASQIKTPLTTMAVRKVELGKVAATLILEHLTYQRDYPIKISIPTILKERDTVLKIEK
ncbi:MAG: GntR family transcriptional regulator [Halanaerobiales bacterium]|nr:GntR family transcriptional regulator [Halanaerobiales bacterium]